uniref:Uncharacterized protein n=1 Tax=Setaria italica TaxID=4555 RepID=K4AIB5_SETIT
MTWARDTTQLLITVVAVAALLRPTASTASSSYRVGATTPAGLGRLGQQAAATYRFKVGGTLGNLKWSKLPQRRVSYAACAVPSDAPTLASGGRPRGAEAGRAVVLHQRRRGPLLVRDEAQRQRRPLIS